MSKKYSTIIIGSVLLLALATPCVWLAAVNRQKRLDRALFEAARIGTGEDVKRAIEAGGRLEATHEDLDSVHVPMPLLGDWINPLYLHENIGLDITPAQDLTNIYGHGRRALHQAAICSNTSSLKTLLQLGAHPDTTDDKGVQPIHLAALTGNIQAIQCLLDAGVDVNAVDANGWQAMHYAVHGYRDRSGPGWNGDADWSKNPSSWSTDSAPAFKREYEIVSLLKKSGAKTSEWEAEEKVNADENARLKASGIPIAEMGDEDIDGPIEPAKTPPAKPQAAKEQSAPK